MTRTRTTVALVVAALRAHRVFGGAVGAGAHPTSAAVDDHDDGTAADHHRGAGGRADQPIDDDAPADHHQYDADGPPGGLGGVRQSVGVADARKWGLRRVGGRRRGRRPRPHRRVRLPGAASVRPAARWRHGRGSGADRTPDDRAATAARRGRGERSLPHRQHLQDPHRHRGPATRRVRLSEPRSARRPAAGRPRRGPDPGSRRRRDHRAPAAVPHLRSRPATTTCSSGAPPIRVRARRTLG